MKLEVIQLVRGVAACMVAMNHIYNDGWIPGAVVDFGAFGVDLFFVISGFIMCLTVNLSHQRYWDNAFQFLKKRVVRIFPLYLICAIPLIIYVTLRTGAKDFYYYLGNLLLLPSFNNDPTYSLALPPGWTLVYEMLFYYLFFAALFFFKSKHKLLFFVFGVIVVTFFATNMLGFVGPRLSWVNFSFIIGHVQILNFALGILTYFVYHKFKNKLSVSVFKWVGLSIVLSFVVVLTIYLKMPTPYVALICSFLIITLATLTPNDLSNNKIGRFFLLLGNASYSIYLVHFYFAFFKPKVVKLGSQFITNNSLNVNLVNFFMCAGAILTGVLMYNYIEKRINAKIHNRIAKK